VELNLDGIRAFSSETTDHASDVGEMGAADGPLMPAGTPMPVAGCDGSECDVWPPSGEGGVLDAGSDMSRNDEPSTALDAS
jgi:hypothetical protein